MNHVPNIEENEHHIEQNPEINTKKQCKRQNFTSILTPKTKLLTSPLT